MVSDSRLRYCRHYVLNEIGKEGQRKLLSSKVLVVGAGGLGSAAIAYLAAAGVGTLGIMDPDQVELSNLQRQILHTTERIGMNKAFSARESALALNPDLEIRAFAEKLTTQNADQMVKEYDFILDCTDRFESKFLINDACVLNKKPFSHAGVVRFRGQVMTYLPGRGPCLRCLMGGIPPKDSYPLCSQVGVIGAVVGTIGSIQALEAIKYLLGVGELLVGKIYCFDGLSMKTNLFEFPKADPNCRVCGSTPFSLRENAREYGEI